MLDESICDNVLASSFWSKLFKIKYSGPYQICKDQAKKLEIIRNYMSTSRWNTWNRRHTLAGVKLSVVTGIGAMLKDLSFA